MVKEQFLIVFLTFIQIISSCFPENVSGTGKSFIELEFFHEHIFEYRTSYCDYSCWDIVTKNLCGMMALTNEISCDDGIITCSWLGRTEACLSRRGQPKFQWVSAIRNKKSYRYGKNHHRCRIEEGFVPYGMYYRSSNDYSYCNCRCLKKQWRVHLGELKSRESDNYVIVDVRFQAKNKVLFLQPAEGRLEANGKISDISWIPLPDNPVETRSIDLDSRIFFLNDVRLRSSYLLTGVKFEFMNTLSPKNISGFSIALSGVPLDYGTGKLDIVPLNRKIVRTNELIYRQPLEFVRKNPIDDVAEYPCEPSERRHNYITLEQSELNGDFGQSTLPLFYNDSNVINEYSPLSGIGIFHNGSRYHSGFLYLQLFPIDFEKIM